MACRESQGLSSQTAVDTRNISKRAIRLLRSSARWRPRIHKPRQEMLSPFALQVAFTEQVETPSVTASYMQGSRERLRAWPGKTLPRTGSKLERPPNVDLEANDLSPSCVTKSRFIKGKGQVHCPGLSEDRQVSRFTHPEPTFSILPLSPSYSNCF